ncbi:Unknown protein [Striga hermonthica]|uniref:Uncharacterized protein n=1 Tax=Striga hermonthica TaxID=68872 RepID=A0A9N7MLN6_STRHE|nr:Unknown protein [Striga hermonthica]
MDIWSWICELPNLASLDPPNSPLTFQLAINADSTHSIHLRATPDSETSNITFFICLDDNPQPAWFSDTCSLSSDKPFLPLLLQLLHEIVSRSPTFPRPQLGRGLIRPEPVSWALDSHLPDSFSSFFTLIFLTRLFWLCACDSPPEFGSLYFHSLLSPNLALFSCRHAPVLTNFFLSAGADVELCLARSFGYVLAKWLDPERVSISSPEQLANGGGVIGVGVSVVDEVFTRVFGVVTPGVLRQPSYQPQNLSVSSQRLLHLSD